MKKPLPPVFFIFALIAMVTLHFVIPMKQYWGIPISLVGLVPIILGIALNITADNLFKKHQTTIKPFEPSAALVTEFPFSMSRNPMYVGVTLMLFGVALLLGSLTPLLPAMTFPVLMDLLFIRAEEKMLADRFGPDWERYRERVRRWL